PRREERRRLHRLRRGRLRRQRQVGLQDRGVRRASRREDVLPPGAHRDHRLRLRHRHRRVRRRHRRESAGREFPRFQGIRSTQLRRAARSVRKSAIARDTARRYFRPSGNVRQSIHFHRVGGAHRTHHYPAYGGRLRRIALLALVVFLVAPNALPFGQNKIVYDRFNWSIYHSTHFDIFFYDKEKDALQKVVDVAESAYDDLSRKFNFQITKKIPLI